LEIEVKCAIKIKKKRRKKTTLQFTKNQSIVEGKERERIKESY